MQYIAKSLKDVGEMYREQAKRAIEQRNSVEKAKGKNSRDYHIQTAIWSTWIAAAELIETTIIEP